MILRIIISLIIDTKPFIRGRPRKVQTESETSSNNNSDLPQSSSIIPSPTPPPIDTNTQPSNDDHSSSTPIVNISETNQHGNNDLPNNSPSSFVPPLIPSASPSSLNATTTTTTLPVITVDISDSKISNVYCDTHFTTSDISPAETLPIDQLQPQPQSPQPPQIDYLPPSLTSQPQPQPQSEQESFTHPSPGGTNVDTSTTTNETLTAINDEQLSFRRVTQQICIHQESTSNIEETYGDNEGNGTDTLPVAFTLKYKFTTLLIFFR